MVWTPHLPDFTKEDILKDRFDFFRWQSHMRNRLILLEVHDVVLGSRAVAQPEEVAFEEELPEGDDWSTPRYSRHSKDVWTRAFIKSTLEGDIRTVELDFSGSARNFWLHLEETYKPKGFQDARRYLNEFDSLSYSPGEYESVKKFSEALYSPVWNLAQMDGEFQIPYWMWEERFVDLIQEAYPGILETYITAEGMKDNEYDPHRRVEAMCYIVEAHEARHTIDAATSPSPTLTKKQLKRRKRKQQRRLKQNSQS